MRRIAAFACAMVCTAAAAQSALRAHSSSDPRARFMVGPALTAAPYAGGTYYGPPTYYAPPVVYVPTPGVITPPLEYAEQKPVPWSSPVPHWYYCPEARARYPRVKECPGGWKVLPPEAAPAR